MPHVELREVRVNRPLSSKPPGSRQSSVARWRRGEAGSIRFSCCKEATSAQCNGIIIGEALPWRVRHC